MKLWLTGLWLWLLTACDPMVVGESAKKKAGEKGRVGEKECRKLQPKYAIGSIEESAAGMRQARAWFSAWLLGWYGSRGSRPRLAAREYSK
ncbi:hypothetical protein ACFOLG_02790 [Vogesella facilis]|uniref:Lipoprotein n=1 Tax=Vogesella facilis TaxID=1655232 RepID=A0ABV7REL8_9NEIS